MPVSLERREDPAGDLVAAGDAAEDVEQDRTHLRVARDHLERGDDSLGRPAAAEVAEVGGPPAGDDDHVDRRHREPGAVAEDPDRPVELHVDDAALAGERLERVGRPRVSQLGEIRVAPERRVVDGHLRVEGPNDALGRDDERVHLAEGRVRLDVAAVERLDDALDLRALSLVGDARGELAGVVRLEAFERVDVDAHERVGVLGCDLLDLDAALRREHEQRLPGAAVERHREVVLAGDLGGALDPQPADRVPADVEAEDVRLRPVRPRRDPRRA